MPNMKADLLFPKLSYKIVGICFSVHNELGRFAREKQYGDLLEATLKKESIEYERELEVKGRGNILDFYVEKRIVLELKVVNKITGADFHQVQRYLQSTNSKLGILVNFRDKYLRPKRIININ